MRTLFLTGTAALFTSAALAASHTMAPTELWSTEGFANPESVLEDAGRGVLYVSNVNGAPTDKDANGFISRIMPGGEIETLELVGSSDGDSPIHAPKGMVMTDADTLYVTDIDRVHRVDLATSEVAESWDAPGAVFLNDMAVDADGNVYASDIAKMSVWKLSDGELAPFVENAAMHINGLLVEDGTLVVAGWGTGMREDGSTEVNGNLLQVDLTSAEVTDLGSGEPIGNLDGLEADGRGGYLVTDFIAGALYRIQPDGAAEQLIDLNPLSADLEVTDGGKTAIIPQMGDNRVTAWRLEK